MKKGPSIYETPVWTDHPFIGRIPADIILRKEGSLLIIEKSRQGHVRHVDLCISEEKTESEIFEQITVAVSMLNWGKRTEPGASPP